MGTYGFLCVGPLGCKCVQQEESGAMRVCEGRGGLWYVLQAVCFQ